jgi:glycosidase
MDYATIDPAFGDTTDLKILINELHRRNKKIILSVTFTHTGIDFPAFIDIIKNKKASKYRNWYLVKSLPIRTSPPSYECWRRDYHFPRLNLKNPQVKNYLIGYLEYWTRFGFDGFYIGESRTIDAGFVKTLRTHIKSKNQNLLFLGSDARLLSINGFDGCSNRAFTDLIIKYFVKNTIVTSEFDYTIRKLLFSTPSQVNTSNLLNASTYDARIHSISGSDAIRNIYAFIFTFVGSPVILYGDELKLSKSAPLNLGSFDWNPKTQNRKHLQEIRKLIQIRKSYPQIASPFFYTLYVDDINRIYAYDRGGLVVLLNSGDGQSFVELPAWDGMYTDLISGEKFPAYSQRLRLSIPAKSYRILRREI